METIVPREVVRKIPEKAQRLPKNLVGDVARRENDIQVALCDRKRPTVGKSVAEQKPWSDSNCEFVPDVKPGKELFLKLVSVPFQLCAARIRVVILRKRTDRQSSSVPTNYVDNIDKAGGVKRNGLLTGDKGQTR